MKTLKVKLSIGYPTAVHEDEIEIHEDGYNACETEEEKEEFLAKTAQEWANDYIEISHELVISPD